MRASLISTIVLGSFIVAIFILHWWDVPLWEFPSLIPENLQRDLLHVRDLFAQRITLLLPEPHGAFLNGLLLGIREDLPREVLDDFRITGLTHILAISGYNITLLISLLGGIFCWIPRRWRFVPSVILIALFTLLTGASASAVRAAIIGVLGLLAVQAERIAVPRLSLLWAAALMLLYRPSFLWDDLGFQLSFLAVIGLIEIVPLLRPRLSGLPESLCIRESACCTLSVQLMTFPWILYRFGQLSLVAPVSNLLPPLLVPCATITGIAGLAASFLWLPLGQLLIIPAWICLEILLRSAQFLSSLPLASFTIAHLNGSIVGGYYLLLGAGMWLTKRNGATSPGAFGTALSRFRPAASREN